MHSGNMCNLYCSGCEAYMVSSSKAAGRGARCKKCKNKRKREERKLRQIRVQLELIGMLGGKCEGCGKGAHKDNIVCFDFHHIDSSTKEDSISNMLADSRPLALVKKEAEKCILLCACCHRLHHQEYGY